ncbi:Type III secretory pathway protein [gamma proteobacterium HdN1]|nr:Type III secretory pathway protein [gamma proteobacterium HdN1]
MDFNTLNPGTIIVIVVTITMAPFVAVMVTAFTKLVVVLSLLRNSLGLQQTPPNVVLNGLAIILSLYVMYPVLLQTQSLITSHLKETPEAKLTVDRLIEIFDVGKKPLKDFLIRHSKESERHFFLESARQLLPEEDRNNIHEDDFLVIVPAFTVSELSAAFQIGFLLFLPFLIIDLLVSNLLMALGIAMLSPTQVSLPFKLLLFVFISGWTQLIHGLVLTYN